MWLPDSVRWCLLEVTLGGLGRPLVSSLSGGAVILDKQDVRMGEPVPQYSRLHHQTHSELGWGSVAGVRAPAFIERTSICAPRVRTPSALRG